MFIKLSFFALTLVCLETLSYTTVFVSNPNNYSSPKSRPTLIALSYVVSLLLRALSVSITLEIINLFTSEIGKDHLQFIAFGITWTTILLTILYTYWMYFEYTS